VSHLLEFEPFPSGQDGWACSCGLMTEKRTRLGVMEHQARVRLGEPEPSRPRRRPLAPDEQAIATYRRLSEQFRAATLATRRYRASMSTISSSSGSTFQWLRDANVAPSVWRDIQGI